jgi:uncharacterized coiled-coil protein SlyX
MVKISAQIADLEKRIAEAEQWLLQLEQFIAELLRNGSDASSAQELLKNKIWSLAAFMRARKPLSGAFLKSCRNHGRRRAVSLRTVTQRAVDRRRPQPLRVTSTHACHRAGAADVPLKPDRIGEAPKTSGWCHNRQFPGTIDPSTGCVEARRLI